MNADIKLLKVKDIIDRDAAVSSDDGENVHTVIVKSFESSGVIKLDFSDITIMTTAFLNSAIGQLYNEFTSEFLNKNLQLINVAEEDKILFKKVIERAKEYFANKKGFENSADNTIYGS